LRKAAVILIILLLTGFVYGNAQKWDIAQVKRIAAENNLRINSAQQKYSAAKWGVMSAISGFLPHLDFKTNITRLDPYTLDQINYPIRFFPDYITTPKNAFESSLSLKIPIFNGGLIYSNVKTAAAQKKMEESNYKKEKLDIEYAAVKGYLNCLRAEEYLQVQKQAHLSSQKDLDRAKSQYDLGQRSKADLLRWEVDLAEKEQQLVDAENNLRLARLELADILDIDTNELPALKKVSDDKFRMDYALFGKEDDTLFNSRINLWFDIACQNQPNFKMLEARQQIASAGVWRARSQILPKVNFGYNYSWQKDNDIYLDERTFWSAAISIDIPLFTGLGNYSELKKARALERAEKYLINDDKKALRLQITSTALTMKAALLKVVSVERAKQQAEANLKLIKQRYNLGMLSTVDMLDAESAYIRSRGGFIDALYNYYILTAQLESLIGQRGLTAEFTYDEK